MKNSAIGDRCRFAHGPDGWAMTHANIHVEQAERDTGTRTYETEAVTVKNSDAAAAPAMREALERIRRYCRRANELEVNPDSLTILETIRKALEGGA